MSGNNNNDQSSWKNKLDELESLPGDTFDKNVSWEKLRNGEKETPKTKRRFWYWMAAACMLAVISLPWFFTNEKNIPPIVKTDIPVIRKKLNDTVVLPTVDFVTKDPLIEKKLSYKKIIRQQKNAINIDTNLAVDPLPQQLQEMIVLENPLTDTLKLASVPVKKKLKVIRFNELGNPDENNSMEENGRPFFPVKFRTKEIYTNNAGSGKDNLIRIKLSSQN